MYSERVVQQRLKATFEGLNKSLRSDAEVVPEYHTPAECQAARRHLEKIRDPETGNLTRKIEPDEYAWIRNERLVCQCDFLYWETRYAMIRDWTDRVSLIVPNVAQKMVVAIWGQMEEAQHAILMLQLKARRLGVSTQWELATAHRVQFYSNVNAVVASSDPDKSAEMAGIMELAWQNQPWWLMPAVTAQRSGTLIEFGMQNSAVSIQHGTQFSGIARGATPSTFHLSELPDFKDPEGLIDASLLRAVIDSPSTFGGLESTAAGRGNWLHKKWKYSVQNWPATSRLRPVFLPWYVGSDIYPTDTWIRQHPIPRNHKFESLTLKHAERATEYVRSNDLLRKNLGDDWKMPPRQMWFWEATRKEYEAQGATGKFLAELCSDDVEAFQHDKHNPFGVEVINEYQNSTSRITPRVYGFIGKPDTIPERLQPDRRDIDTEKAPIYPKPLPGAPAEAPRNVKLVPLRWNGAAGFDPLGKLLVWRDWEPGYIYANGIDTAYGIGKDRSVIETLRKGTLERNDEQVAEFASPAVNAADLAPIAYIVGSLYSSIENGYVKQCHQAIEVQANGEITQLQLRKMGWKEFHHWVRYDRRRINPKKADRLGWATVSWSRALLMSWCIKYLRDGWVDINSPWFVEEMQALVQDDYQQQLKAEYGEYDDRFMAFGIALVHLHMLESRMGTRMIAEERVALRAIDDEDAPPEVYSRGNQTEAVYARGAERLIAEHEDSW
jgi:hypothetical protein